MYNEIQSRYCSENDKYKPCSFDREYISEATKPLIHQESRFLYISKGKGKIRIDNTEYTISENSLIIILPWEITEVIEVYETLDIMKIIYNSVFFNNIIKSFNFSDTINLIYNNINDIPIINFNRLNAKKIKNIFMDIKNEIGIESDINYNKVKKEKSYSDILSITKIIELLIIIQKEIENSDKQNIKKESDIEEIIKYIYSHMNEKLTLNKLSMIFFTSETLISKSIHELTGITFNELLRNMRINKAMDLLVYTDLNINDISHLVGFVDAAHISNLCNKYMNMNPNKYRNMYKDIYQVFNRKDKKLAFEIFNYIKKNYNKDIKIKEISQIFDISTIKINKMIQYYIDMNLNSFINYLRINKSSELLIETELEILEIAITVGYNTIKTFNNNFLKIRNMTPTEYRNKMNNK